jgi:hypothetical protein
MGTKAYLPADVTVELSCHLVSKGFDAIPERGSCTL